MKRLLDSSQRIGQALFASLIDVVYPSHCLISGEPLLGEQDISRQALDACDPAPSQTELLLTLQRHSVADETYLSSITALYSVGSNIGIDNVIYAIKYSGRVRVAEQLGRALGSVLVDKGLHFDSIVPVPIHPSRFRERGYNQAEVIARGVAEVLGVHIQQSVVRLRSTVSQTTLSDANRQTNVNNVFSIDTSHIVKGQSVLLVDDVFTTGATLNACAEVLLNNGATRVDATTIGATV